MNEKKNKGANDKLYNPNTSFNKAKMSLVSNISLYSEIYHENNLPEHTNSCVQYI